MELIANKFIKKNSLISIHFFSISLARKRQNIILKRVYFVFLIQLRLVKLYEIEFVTLYFVSFCCCLQKSIVLCNNNENKKKKRK
jgi:hypothetical protein